MSLTLAAIYAPYLLLVFVEGARQNWSSMLAIWPIFPGFTLSFLVGAFGRFNHLRGMGSAFVLTVVFLAIALFLCLRFTRSLWAILAATTLASTALVYVVVLMLRA